MGFSNMTINWAEVSANNKLPWFVRAIVDYTIDPFGDKEVFKNRKKENTPKIQNGAQDSRRSRSRSRRAAVNSTG